MYDPIEFTIPEIIEKSSARYAERPALAMIGEPPLHFSDIEPRSRRIAAYLGYLGIHKGDKVALLSENRPEWGITYFGISRSGAVAVPILTDFMPEQIGNILAHSEAKAVFVSKRFLPKVEKEGERRLILSVEDLTVIAGPKGAKGPSPAEIDAAAAAFSPPRIAGDDLATIIYTSGTTGLSKGVMLTHKNLVWDAKGCCSIIVLNRRDRLLSILPLAHTYEFTLGLILPLLQGSAVYYLDRPPSATALLPALKSIRPTIMLTVPLVIDKIYRTSVLPALEKISLYKSPLFRPLLERIAGKKLYKTFGGKLRFFGVGGAPLAADVEAFLIAGRFPYAIGYGLTETSPMAAGFHPYKGAPRSTGPAMRGVEVRVADPRPDTHEGEIQIRGPNVTKGYYLDPARTAEAFTPDGFFKTGDLGYIDDKGRIFIRGRSKTMILGASGENIYPEEVEAVLNRSPYVQESLVYGDESGITALIQLKPEVLQELAARVKDGVEGAELAASHLGHAAGEAFQSAEHAAAQLLERIKKEANAKLASFSRIGTVEHHAEPFEKTPTQKIKRFLYPRKKDN